MRLKDFIKESSISYPDGIEWDEDKLNYLGGHFADQLHRADEVEVANLMFNSNEDPSYGAVLRVYDENGKMSSRDVAFNIDTGGGTPYPIDIDDGSRIHTLGRVDLCGINSDLEFVNHYDGHSMSESDNAISEEKTGYGLVVYVSSDALSYGDFEQTEMFTSKSDFENRIVELFAEYAEDDSLKESSFEEIQDHESYEDFVERHWIVDKF